MDLNDIEQIKNYIEQLKRQIARGRSGSVQLLEEAEQDLKRLEARQRDTNE